MLHECVCNCVATLAIAMSGCGPQNSVLEGHRCLLYTELSSINSTIRKLINYIRHTFPF
jgi:hypothetical protein